MGRAWTAEDDARCERSRADGPTAQREPTELDELAFVDVLRGCLGYFVAVLLHRLRLAAPPARSLAREMEAARDSRALAEWIAAPMPDLPVEVEVAAITDG